MKRETEGSVAPGIASVVYGLLPNTDGGKQGAEEYTRAGVAPGPGMAVVFLRLVLPERHWHSGAKVVAVVWPTRCWERAEKRPFRKQSVLETAVYNEQPWPTN